MAIDFTTPTKLQQYDTGVLQSIRDNQFALACFLDGAGPIYGNPAAGIKRYNASSTFFERWTGTQYVEMPLGYLKTSGGNLTGNVTSPDPSAPTHLATKNYVDYVASSKANSSALGAYMPIAGGTFAGSIATNGSLSVNGNISLGNNLFCVSVIGSNAVIAGDAGLTTQGTFYMSAAGPTTPILNWDAGDYMAYDRAGNSLYFYMGGNRPLLLTPTGAVINGSVTIASDGGGNGYSGTHRIFNNGTGGGPYFRVNPSNGLEFVNSAYSKVTATIQDSGDFLASGRLFANGGGDGLGAIHVQQGGAPSGGSPGDLWFIW